MKKSLLLLSFLVFNACKPTVVDYVVSRSRTVIDIGDAKFAVEENSVADSQRIRIEKKAVPKSVYPDGYRIVGPAYVIGPATMVFEKPIRFAWPASKKNLKLAVKIAKGFVPLAGSEVIDETLQAKIRHGGEYFVVETPEKYGILNPVKTDQGLLIVSDMYVGKYLDDFKKALKKEGYNYPVWTFVYSGAETIEENAKFLAEELKRLHAEYGKFRLDVVSFGVGGLVTHRYVADSALYGYDISSAIIAVGTSFFGSNFADYDSLTKSQSPYRFFFIDAMGNNAQELAPGSDFIKWMIENRSIVGWLRKDLDENKNFASLSGKKVFNGSLPEDNEGDFLVAWKSTQLTWIEPEPFPLDHFELYESRTVQELAVKFIELYRSFNWPRLFSNVWEGKDNIAKINETWEKETKLTFRKPYEYDIILEWNENLLKSTPPDAILITNGDMDTYPGWLLQGKGIRQDVIIVNRSLLNTTGYIRFLQKNGLPLDLSSEQINNLTHYIDKKTGKIVTISDQLISRLAQQRTRPLVLSTTVWDPQAFGVSLILNGLVYRFGTGGVDIGSEWFTVDLEKNDELFFNKFNFDKITSEPFDSLNQSLQGLTMNYGTSLYALGKALLKEKKYNEALRVISFAIEHFNQPKPLMGPFYYLKAEVDFDMGDKYKADSVLREFVNLPFRKLNKDDSLNLINVYKDAASLYVKMGDKEEAIKLLAECLKITPNNKELLQLINQYQGE
jgi:hypothetical protein